MAKNSENESFAARLRQALEAAGVKTSPTVVANEFNLRYWGRSITPHTARNWLLGKALPTQDKLRVLSDWLLVNPDELRFGPKHSAILMSPGELDRQLDLADREMLNRYLSMPPHEKKIVREVVLAFSMASQRHLLHAPLSQKR